MKRAIVPFLITLIAGHAAFAKTPRKPVPPLDTFHPVVTAPQPAFPVPDLPAKDVVGGLPTRGLNHKFVIHQRSITNQQGEVSIVTNRYWHLESGLHYTNQQGELVESIAKFQVKGGLAVAENLQFKVRLASNPNSAGAVAVTQPDGTVLRSHVSGLRYFDPISGIAVVLAETKESQGVIIADDQVLYADAFKKLNADIRYTLRLNGIEQDVILHEAPPSPASFGLDPATTRLELLTEFLDSPAFTLHGREGRKPEANESAPENFTRVEKEDQAVDFSSMRIGAGRAFSLESQATTIGVGKRWLNTSGRSFLVEAIELNSAKPFLDKLPQSKRAQIQEQRGIGTPSRLQASALTIPEPHTATASAGFRPISPEDMPAIKPSEGFVLDYQAVTTGSTFNNFTFQGDTTYYVSGAFGFTGNTVIEGGAVIKFPKMVGSADGTIWIGGTLDCQTSPYRPAIFAPCDDNSIGEGLPGNLSTGTVDQAYAYGYRALACWYGVPAFDVHDIRFIQVAYAVYIANQANNKIHNCQIVSRGWPWTTGVQIVGNPGSSAQYTDYIGNVLFSSLGVAIGYQQPVANTVNLTIENVTSDNNYYFCVKKAYSLFRSINMKNSLHGPLWGPLTDDIISTPGGEFQDLGGNFVYASRPDWANLFSTVDTAHFYLPWTSSKHGAGTGQGDPLLFKDLATASTYPPLILPATIVNGTVLSPNSPRDLAISDPGYHYPVIDYSAPYSGVNNVTLTLTNGVALEWGTSVAAFWLANNGSIVSQGLPDNLNRIVHRSMIGEAPPGFGFCIFGISTNSPSINLRFTEINCSYRGGQLTAPSSGTLGQLILQDCQLFGLYFNYAPPPTSVTSVVLANNVFDRCSFRIDKGTLANGQTSGLSLSVFNNLFNWVTDYASTYSQTGVIYQATFEYGNSAGNPTWYITDNYFNHTVALRSHGLGYDPAVSNNGFTTDVGTTGLNPTQNNCSFINGPLGKWYQSTAGLYAKGSRSGASAGLAHHTTRVNQAPEWNSAFIDIGFHYIAGNPNVMGFAALDSDQDSVPDYIEDSNGDGAYNALESDWQNGGDAGLKIWISSPRAGSIIP